MEILPVGNRIYLAGGFDYVGPATGYGVGVDAAAGAKLPGAPVVRRRRAGRRGRWPGWVVHRRRLQVRRRPVPPYAAQITAAGAVTNWNPKPDQPVEALAFDGAKVYLGGNFTTVRDLPAPRLAAVTPTGVADLAPGFQGGADGRVTSLVAAAGALFAGGEFGNDRRWPARPRGRASTPRPVRRRPPSPVPPSRRASAGRSLLTGPRCMPAATSPRPVGPDGTGWRRSTPPPERCPPWAPGADNVVRSLAVDPASGVVFAGGVFGNVGGAPWARLAAIQPDGAVLAFDAALNGCHVKHSTNDAHSNPACDTSVDSLTAANGLLYVGGRFNQSGLTSRHDAAAFVLADGALHGWNPVASDRVLALAASNGAVFAGGELTSVNGGVRPNLAALDATTGQLDFSFNPAVNDEVLDIAVAPDGVRLYLGGHFGLVGGKKHNRMAAMNSWPTARSTMPSSPTSTTTCSRSACSATTSTPAASSPRSPRSCVSTS